MLERLREELRPLLDDLGIRASRIGGANFWTALGFSLSLVSAFFYFLHVPQLGGASMLLSGFMDVVDGAVARARGKSSPAGSFIDSTMDRLAEIAVYGGIILAGYTDPLFVLLALSLSLMVSYERAKGEALGLKMGGMGIGERAERILVLALPSLVCMVWVGVLLVLVLAAITFVQRSFYLLKSLSS